MRNNSSGIRGSILIITTWCLSLLAILAVSLGFAARQKASFTNRLEAPDILAAAAGSGIDRARALFHEEEEPPAFTTLAERWTNNPMLFRSVAVGEGTFSVSRTLEIASEEKAEWFGPVDEESRINLNFADAPTLARLFQAAGLDPDLAGELSYAVVDWRDSDSNYGHPEHGAEDKDYDNLPEPYFCKDAPYQSVDELLLVKGINRDIFDKIKDFVCVYGSGAVNVHTASKEVLLMTGLPPALVDKILFYRRGEDGREGTADDRYFMQAEAIGLELSKVITIDGFEETELNTAVSQSRLGIVSNYFMVHSRASLKSGASMDAEAVIDREGNIMVVRFSRVQWPRR